MASAQESSRAADLAARFTGDPKKVVNMINIAGGQQVMLKVRIAEMDRNVAKQFGVDLSSRPRLPACRVLVVHPTPSAWWAGR